MSTKEGVTIVSRALAVYFLAWLLYDVTYLPSLVYSYLHYEVGASALADSAYLVYMRNSHLMSLSTLLLRMVVLFFAVQWFYRSGPKIHAYFMASTDDESTSASPPLQIGPH